MTEDMDEILDENEETIPDEERMDSDLPRNIIREEIILSITDKVDIPLFTDEFELPENTPSLINDVFITEISRELPEIISQEVLFEVPAIIVQTPTGTDDEDTYTIFLIFSFILLGLFTIMLMNFYLKRKKQVK